IGNFWPADTSANCVCPTSRIISFFHRICEYSEARTDTGESRRRWFRSNGRRRSLVQACRGCHATVFSAMPYEESPFGWDHEAQEAGRHEVLRRLYGSWATGRLLSV